MTHVHVALDCFGNLVYPEADFRVGPMVSPEDFNRPRAQWRDAVDEARRGIPDGDGPLVVAGGGPSAVGVLIGLRFGDRSFDFTGEGGDFVVPAVLEAAAPLETECALIPRGMEFPGNEKASVLYLAGRGQFTLREEDFVALGAAFGSRFSLRKATSAVVPCHATPSNVGQLAARVKATVDEVLSALRDETLLVVTTLPMPLAIAAGRALAGANVPRGSRVGVAEKTGHVFSLY